MDSSEDWRHARSLPARKMVDEDTKALRVNLVLMIVDSENEVFTQLRCE